MKLPSFNDYFTLISENKEYFVFSYFRVLNDMKGHDYAGLIRHHDFPTLIIADGVSQSAGALASSTAVNTLTAELPKILEAHSKENRRIEDLENIMTEILSKELKRKLQEQLKAVLSEDPSFWRHASTTLMAAVLEKLEYLHAYYIGDSEFYLIYPIKRRYDSGKEMLLPAHWTSPFVRQSFYNILYAAVDETGITGESQYLKLKIPRDGIICILGTDGSGLRDYFKAFYQNLGEILKQYSYALQFSSFFEDNVLIPIKEYQKKIKLLIDRFLVSYRGLDDATLGIISVLPIFQPTVQRVTYEERFSVYIASRRQFPRFF